MHREGTEFMENDGFTAETRLRTPCFGAASAEGAEKSKDQGGRYESRHHERLVSLRVVSAMA